MWKAVVYARSPRALWDKKKHGDEIWRIAGPYRHPWAWLVRAWAKNATRHLDPDRCFCEVELEDEQAVTLQPKG